MFVCVQFFQNVDIEINDEDCLSNGGKVTILVDAIEFLRILSLGSIDIERIVLANVKNKFLVIFVEFADDLGSFTSYLRLIDSVDVMEQ